jgi:hypothetical protein
MVIHPPARISLAADPLSIMRSALDSNKFERAY